VPRSLTSSPRRRLCRRTHRKGRSCSGPRPITEVQTSSHSNCGIIFVHNMIYYSANKPISINNNYLPVGAHVPFVPPLLKRPSKLYARRAFHGPVPCGAESGTWAHCIDPFRFRPDVVKGDMTEYGRRWARMSFRWVRLVCGTTVPLEPADSMNMSLAFR